MIPTKKKLVFITRPIAPPWDEGSKNFALYLAKKIHVRGLIPHLLVTQKTIKSIPANIAQIPLYSQSQLTFLTKLRLFFFLLKTDADIAHFIFVLTPLTSAIIKFLFMFKTTKSLQTIVSLNVYSPFILKLITYGDSLVCLSNMVAKKLRKAGIPNVHTIPPGVDINEFLPGKKENTIAFLGELYRMESYFIIEKLLPLLAHAFPSYVIVLGFRFSNKLPQEYVLREKLRARTTKIKDRIVWQDVIENMPKFLESTKLVIFPATNMRGKFDFPLVLVESLACGTPVVVSPINPLMEYSQYEGVKTPFANTPISFMETVQKSLDENSYKALSKAARETAVKHFSIQEVVKKYEQIYKNLLAS